MKCALYACVASGGSSMENDLHARQTLARLRCGRIGVADCWDSGGGSARDNSLTPLQSNQPESCSVGQLATALLRSAPLVNWASASLRWRCMSCLALGLKSLSCCLRLAPALTLAVFFLALWLLPVETFTPFPFPRFHGFF